VVDLTSDWKVLENNPQNMTVNISSGRGFFKKTSITYHGYSDSVENISIGANNSGNPRIDAVVLYVDLTATPNSDASNVLKAIVVQGTPASSPVAPTDNEIQTAIGSGNPFLRLANVYVENGASSITNGNITDTRVPAYLKTPGGIYLDGLIKGKSSGSDINSGNSEERVVTPKAIKDAGLPYEGEASGSDVDIGTNRTKYVSSKAIADSNITFNTKSQNIRITTPFNIITDPGTGTITFDLAVSRNQLVTLTGNRTLALSNVATGMVFMITLKQDSAGSRTVTWWDGISWVDGSAPILTTTPNKADTFGFICTGTNTYYGYVVGQNI